METEQFIQSVYEIAFGEYAYDENYPPEQVIEKLTELGNDATLLNEIIELINNGS